LIGKAFQLHHRDRARAVRALVWLIAASVAVRFVPFATISRAIARIPASRSPRAVITPAECGTAVRRAGRIWPVARCLPQAIAGYCLLRRAGLSGTLILGARMDGDRVDAHAWLDYDGVTVIGGDVVHRYTPLVPAERPRS
jgi:hypothetical protein